MRVGRLPQTTWTGGGGYGDTSRPWSEIAASFAELPAANPVFADLAAFVLRVADSPFALSGLCGMNSMHDLVVGMSRCIGDNPHLVISYDFDARLFRFEYRDGSAQPWTRTAEAEEAYDAFERFVTKRARWFRVPAPR